ncbi:hypothetical protein CBS147330_5244 [Penicillium roqueforti]|nr:hypothetical protein CBS147330_5244 [Penicillium roqueforti]
MDEVKPDRQLKGKTNFISWKREFERAARANDVLEFLTGEEVVPPKPNKDEYFVKVLDTETRRSTRIKKSLSPTTDDENETEDGQTVVLTTNNTLRWQIDHNEHKNAKEKMKLANRLLDAWISDGIKIEIEDCADAKETYDFIKKRYAVTNERARDILLNRLNDLKLDHCSSVTDYTNQIRQIKADLKTVKYDMTDDMFATALLHGLPPNYRSFKEKYDWVRSIKPDDSPDLDYLFERMHVEEMHQLQMKEERKARDKAKRDASNNSTMNMDNSTRYRPRREDRNHLKCTHPGCGKTGHTEEHCWVKNPEKIPRSLKEKSTNTTNRAVVPNGMGGVAEMDLIDSKDTYIRSDALGTGPSLSTHAKPADPSPQMHRAMSCIKLRGSGGVDMGDPVSATLDFSKPVLGAFLAGSFCTTDTWLADTGANMHIVNDMKWFKKDTFRTSNLKISTADGSTSLEIEGMGVVNLLLKCPDGVPVKVSLSEVAYAPRGKCNLFSGGMFTRKANLTGIYNKQYMTWMNDAGHAIGHAAFGNGLYHLDATKLPNDDITSGVIAATVDFDDPVWKWHRRLGHLGFQSMLNLLRSSTGMEITEKQIKAKLKAVCPVCATTRALVRIPRDPATRHAQQPGAMVHMDVWGPYPIEGFDGTRYFLFITDDCTRYTWSARFDKKYQLFEVFKSLVKLIQKVFNITIRCCRFDNEFERGPIGKWCNSHSIAREPIEPYAHYQNGVAERTNRTICEKAAPMVQETSISGQVSKIISEKGNELLRISKIPENLWPEAIQHAVWLKNRTPARALRKKDAKTPYEALRGMKPSLTRERIWGSRAYVTYPQELRHTAEMTKLHNPRGWLGYFVGCESEAMYHIYSPEKHKVYRIGVARIEDGEGLRDPHDAPCLEDRIPTPDVAFTDNNHSEDGSESSSDSDKDYDDGESSHDQHTVISSDEEIADQEHHVSEAAHESQDEVEDADDEDDTDNGDLGLNNVSKYFNQSKHAGMAKRKFPDDPIVAPRKSRRATHGQRDINLEHSDSDLSDLNDDSWYHSEDGKVSQAYWQFVAKRGGGHMKNFLPDDDKCDRCFRTGRRTDQSIVEETIDSDPHDDENHGRHAAAKNNYKGFKFSLSAYNELPQPALQLKNNGTANGKYLEAKVEELNSHKEKGTWKVVPLQGGIKPVTSRWVTTDKYGPDGEVARRKARLVARGFQQEEGIDYEETFASVVKSASTRILLALAAICHWHVHQGDVKTAFLNSDLDKPVYMKAPADVQLPRGHCLLLIKALYGLKQSPRAWYQKLRDTLVGWGWRMSAYDPCVFINDRTRLILEVHVDDINVMGRGLQAILDFKGQLSKEFPISDEGECSWYLGMHIEQKPGEIHLHQKQYIDQMVNKYGFKDAAPAKTPLDTKIKLAKQGDYVANTKFRKEYQSKVGSLNFSSNQTRPDIAFATGYVARYASNPNRAHMDAVDRIFAYLKSDARKGIVYSDKHGLQLRGFVDSDFAGCEDSRKSTTGWVFTLAGGPISWSSQRQKTVATSTMDAEYIACAEAAKEAMWIRNFINDLRIPGP